MKKCLITAVRRTTIATSVIIVAFSVFACAAHVSRSEYGTVKIAVGGGRGLETGWPDGVTPTFGSVVVTVSAADMETMSKTFSGGSGTIELSVPAGSNRLIQVVASGGNAPYFALAYGGSTTVDLSEGETTTATITLALTKTKILLPDRDAFALYSANSISGGLNADSISGFNFTENSDPSFDPYGRLYLFNSYDWYLNRFTASLTQPEQVDFPDLFDYGTAYSPSNQRLYFFRDNAGSFEIQYYDVTQEGDPSSVWVSQPSEVYRFQAVVAADETGSVYACSNEEAIGYERIVKMTIGPESAGSAYATQVNSVLYSDIGLTYAETALTVQDLYVKDGVLYIAASRIAGSDEAYYNSTNFFCRGKVVALSAGTLAKLWEVGWDGDSNQFPTVPAEELYAPKRFIAIAPKKLYVADDGYYVTGPMNSRVCVNQNRVIEIDMDSGSISAIGLEDVVEFYTNYAYSILC